MVNERQFCQNPCGPGQESLLFPSPPKKTQKGGQAFILGEGGVTMVVVFVFRGT